MRLVWRWGSSSRVGYHGRVRRITGSGRTGECSYYLSCVDHCLTSVLRNARVETLFIYAQSIYLIFASVYVCKETVEHLLLSHGEGHHHHSGDETVDLTGYVDSGFFIIVGADSMNRIDFPVTLLCTILISLITSAIAFDNQAKFVSSMFSSFQCSKSKFSHSIWFRSRKQLHPIYTVTTPCSFPIPR